MKFNLFRPSTWFNRDKSLPSVVLENRVNEKDASPISPGRVSVPDDALSATVYLRKITNIVNPPYFTELVPLLRDLYKVNPDVSIALQDMFKLANTPHRINFPHNSTKEAMDMRDHLYEVQKNWSKYTAGIYGLITKMIVQALVGGAISIEAVPKDDLSGIATILFIKPETIRFKRLDNGEYHPYQLVKTVDPLKPLTEPLVKLNTETFKYIGIYNDTDEPNGIPPFLAALDSIKGQHTMKTNFKHIMELMGMVGFLEAKMEKPPQKPSESTPSYEKRLSGLLRQLKVNLVKGMKDGVVTGFIDDHEFKLNSTTQSLQHLDTVWNMNQQGVANGLGINSNIIGLSANTGEAGAGIMLSKMVSQLRNIQELVSCALEFIYSLELRLAGYRNKGCKVEFATSTISDELKTQQAREYKVRTLVSLYNQGIINQDQFAWEMGYHSPDQKEPRIPLGDSEGAGTVDDSAKKRKREADKDTSDRKTRDKNTPGGRRRDGDSRPTGT